MIEVDVEIEDPAWSDAEPDTASVVEQAAKAALAAALDADPAAGEGGLVVLLASDAAVQALNNAFRGQDKPTNVLSFPAAPNPEDHLGDVALAYGVCAAEAEVQGKSLADHLRHLTIHGVLHLLGYDHQIDSEARTMEALERRILEGMGVPDPYAAERDAT